MASVSLSDALRAEILVYAREACPDEACGFLIGTRDSGPATQDHFRITAVRPARNLHPSSENRFTIDPLEYAKSEAYCRNRAQECIQILGFWHTHPKSPARPSAVDLEEALGLQQSFPLRYLYLILSLENLNSPTLACWRLNPQADQFESVDLRS